MARHFCRVSKTKKLRQKLINFRKTQKRASHTRRINKAKKYVRNFSNYELNDAETFALSKGIKFIINPPLKHARRQLINDFDEFSRKLRCAFLYDTGEPYQKHPFYMNSGFNPKTNCNAIENYIFATRNELSNICIKRNRPNITNKEKQALYDLSNNQNIIIKKADKNSTICILNATNYINEGLRQLNNDIFYQELNEHHMDVINKSTEGMINSLHDNNFIDDITFKFLKSNINSDRIGQFFMLPKIHKLTIDTLQDIENNAQLRNNLIIPGRPIVSLKNTHLQNIGKFIDYFLKPLVQKQYTYIRDTKHFINIIESTKLQNNTYLVTFDAKNMYTCLEFEEIKTAAFNALSDATRADYTIPLPPVNELMALLELVLNNNIFTFNNKTYRQKVGVPMGGAASAELADLRMYEIFEGILRNFNNRNCIKLCRRFRDDGFLVMQTSLEEIHRFFEIANQTHPHLKFTYEISEESITFLDVTVYKGQRFQSEHVLDIITFIKPTETFQYLDRNSAHPQTVFKGFIKGEIIRYIRNTSDQSNLLKLIQQFKRHLLDRNYPSDEIDTAIHEALCLNREDLLRDKNRDKPKAHVFVTKFNPAIKQLKRKLTKHWHLLQENNDNASIFNQKPIVAYKRHKNLQEIINRKN